MSTNYKTQQTLDQIYISNDCGCKKPEKKSCGCKKEEKNACNCKDFFTVENLFSELRSEWQKDAARLNLGITDIYNIEMIPSTENGGINELIITYRKGYNEWKKSYQIRNGQMGKISSASVSFIEPGQNPHIAIDETENGQNLIFYLPRADKGDKGDPFRYEDFTPAQLAGLKGDPGKDGKDGNKGDKGDKGDTGVGISEITYSLDQNITGYEGKGTKVFVTLTNGNTYDFFVPNGKDGQGGEGEGGDSSYPNIPMYVYAYRRNNSSTPPAINTFSSGDNWPMGWTRHQSGVNESYQYEWAVVAENVTYENNHFVYSNWSDPFIVARYGKDGNDGNDGADGINGSSGNQGQEGAQGLTGPVIRFRGEYSTSHDVQYVNEENYTHRVNEEVDPTYIRYIDIVFYKDQTDETDNGNYYKVKPTMEGNGRRLVIGHSTYSYQPKQDTADWEQAEYFDFAYIETLISKYISTITLDAREIRIISNSGHLVAGMTSGKLVPTDPSNITNDSTDPVRIWAGTNTNINTDNSINLKTAPFQVRQSGKLIASDANVKGDLSVTSFTLLNNNGSYIEGVRQVILQNVDSSKHRVIYIFTPDEDGCTIEGDGVPLIYKYGDTIMATNEILPVDKNSVYQAIRVDSGWRIIKWEIPYKPSTNGSGTKEETLNVPLGDVSFDIDDSGPNVIVTFTCNTSNLNWSHSNYTGKAYANISYTLPITQYECGHESINGEKIGEFDVQYIPSHSIIYGDTTILGTMTFPKVEQSGSIGSENTGYERNYYYYYYDANEDGDFDDSEEKHTCSTVQNFVNTYLSSISGHLTEYTPLAISITRKYTVQSSAVVSDCLPNGTLVEDGKIVGYADISQQTVTNISNHYICFKVGNNIFYADRNVIDAPFSTDPPSIINGGNMEENNP